MATLEGLGTMSVLLTVTKTASRVSYGEIFVNNNVGAVVRDKHFPNIFGHHLMKGKYNVIEVLMAL